MAVVRCEQAHYYDGGKYPSCPHCKDGGVMSDQKTVAGVRDKALKNKTSERRLVDFGAVSAGEEKTVGIFKKKHGWNPVVGWLVCVGGPEKGRDYRLHTGRNFLGRAPQMDIPVTGDAEVSRENHCSVAYDHKSRAFLLAPGSANTTLNGAAVTEAVRLNASDVIGAGASEFVFVPFCGEGREW
jgi:hypothetical protein